MSTKSSHVYAAVEGAALHVYHDIVGDQIYMELDYTTGKAYGTNLTFIIGTLADTELVALLKKIDDALDAAKT